MIKSIVLLLLGMSPLVSARLQLLRVAPAKHNSNKHGGGSTLGEFGNHRSRSDKSMGDLASYFRELDFTMSMMSMHAFSMPEEVVEMSMPMSMNFGIDAWIIPTAQDGDNDLVPAISSDPSTASSTAPISVTTSAASVVSPPAKDDSTQQDEHESGESRVSADVTVLLGLIVGAALVVGLFAAHRRSGRFNMVW